MSDDIINPPHYTQGKIECIKAIRAALTPEEFRGHCKACAIKYVWRMNLKGQEQDNIRKAIRYLEMLLEGNEQAQFVMGAERAPEVVKTRDDISGILKQHIPLW